MIRKPVPAVEPLTLLLLLACYGGWALATSLLAAHALPLAIVATALLITLHSSLQHEVLHGHPTRLRWLNEALVFPALGLLVPYGRFRDTHLAHHNDETLTDPYDDPESNFQDPRIWQNRPKWQRALYLANNTLLGRILLGPALSMMHFVASDLRALRRGEYKIALCWGLHLLGVALVLWWLLSFGAMPLWAYCAAAYLGFGLLKIRTYLEHRANVSAKGRSVIIESRGPLAFLFLNNNFHAVHHAHPGVPWYRLPGLYAQNRQAFLRQNGGYVFASYLPVFARYLLRAKDPVAHPLRGHNSANSQ